MTFTAMVSEALSLTGREREAALLDVIRFAVAIPDEYERSQAIHDNVMDRVAPVLPPESAPA